MSIGYIPEVDIVDISNINNRKYRAVFKSIRLEIQQAHNKGIIDKRKTKKLYIKMGLVKPKMKI